MPSLTFGFRCFGLFCFSSSDRKKCGKGEKKKKTKKTKKQKKTRFPLLAPIFDFYAFKTLENIRGQVKSGTLQSSTFTLTRTELFIEIH
jgi:hypothetical protein